MIDLDFIDKVYKENKPTLIDILDKTPEPVTPIITQQDVKNKSVTRYFIRLANDKNYVVEIDKTQYQNFKDNPRFITTKFKWKIIGKKETLKLQSGVNIFGVEDQNRITVADADLTFGGLRNYITNYLEYWVAET